MEDVKALYLNVLKNNYTNIEGRVSMKEFWTFALVNFGIMFATLIVGGILASLLGSVGSIIAGILFLAYSLFSLAVIVPSICLSIRRLHDIDKSGWFLLLSFIPLIGGLVLLYLLVQRGTEGMNQYGNAPLA